MSQRLSEQAQKKPECKDDASSESLEELNDGLEVMKAWEEHGGYKGPILGLDEADINMVNHGDFIRGHF